MSSKKFLLISSDGQRFEVDEAVILQSIFIKNLAEDIDDNQIQLTNVNGSILKKIVEYMKKHADVDKNNDHDRWDFSFIKVEEDTLLDVMTAADHLKIPKLLDLTLSTVAAMMEKKDTKDLRKLFNITSDYTAEEEAQIRQEIQWAFE